RLVLPNELGRNQYQPLVTPRLGTHRINHVPTGRGPHRDFNSGLWAVIGAIVSHYPANYGVEIGLGLICATFKECTMTHPFIGRDIKIDARLYCLSDIYFHLPIYAEVCALFR